MRRRNNRRVNFYNNEEEETKKIVIISLIVLIIAILTFTITFIVYRNYLNRQTKIAKANYSELSKVGKIEKEDIYEVSASMEKKVNEIDIKTKDEKVSENIISNEENNSVIISNETEEIKETETKKEDITKEKNKVVVKKEEKVPDPIFKRPVDGGDIVKGFAKDTLVYSNTLQEWVTHTGIDIKVDKTSIVKASADGIIQSIKSDPRYGITVVVEHVNGYKSIYSNLLTAEFIKEKEKVSQGQTIGTVGNTAIFEIADEPHLHFEILKDGEYLDPEQYI